MRWFSLLVILLGGTVAVCGCRSAREPGQEVRGTVTLDGKPLSSGSVVLVPAQGTRGPKCYALVQQGRFHIPASRGPFPGTYRVEVYSAVQLRVPLPEVEQAQPDPPGEPPVAPRFNTQSQLTVTISPEEPAELTLAVSSRDSEDTSLPPR